MTRADEDTFPPLRDDARHHTGTDSQVFEGEAFEFSQRCPRVGDAEQLASALRTDLERGRMDDAMIYGLFELAVVTIVIVILTAPFWAHGLVAWMTRPFWGASR